MNILEPLLKKGEVSLSCIVYPLFLIGYRPYDSTETKIIAWSDRGLEHLFMLLSATVDNDLALIAEIDDVYRYPVSMVQPSKEDEELFSLKDSYVQISLKERFYQVRIIVAKVPSLDVFPALYVKRGKSYQIDRAWNMALNGSLKLLPYTP